MTLAAAADPDELIVVVGPTASGKTELAVRLAESQNGEIISADSVQVYRRFDIGTGKPSAGERRRAPHHLVDVIDPDEPMDAARWVGLAEAAIGEIRGRGRRPLVCGGTFLWVRALVYGLAQAPPGNAAVREQHRALVEAEGRAALHARLGRVDPESAARLAPNDFVRVSRALEVFELSQVPLSRWQAEHGFRQMRHRARFVGVPRSSEELDARIRTRVRAMLDAGWVDEVRGLLDAGLAGARAMRSVGYRQIAEVLGRGPLDPAGLELAIVRATRIFARRQRTWLRDVAVEPVVSSTA